MKLVSKIYFFVFCCFAVSAISFAQSRQALPDNVKDQVQLTVCSQNLKNYSAASPTAPRTEKEGALIKRFVEAQCDVIAVQEVLGTDEDKAKLNLERLAKLLKNTAGRTFIVKAGELNDATQRVGFLVASDRAEILNTVTYRKLLLPKLDDAQKPRMFVRAPLEVQLQVKGRGEASDKQVSLVNFHFKSKSNSKDDPALLQWETYRMEMAEGLRRVVLQRHQKPLADGQPLILIGDRNSHFDTASARILEGSLRLEDFKGQGGCRLNKRGAPLCQADKQKPIEFISVITDDPDTSRQPGTYRYDKTYSFLDDILISPKSTAFFRTQSEVEGNYDSGIVYNYPKASDHALVYVRMRW